jgi:hypothetical protein
MQSPLDAFAAKHCPTRPRVSSSEAFPAHLPATCLASHLASHISEGDGSDEDAPWHFLSMRHSLGAQPGRNSLGAGQGQGRSVSTEGDSTSPLSALLQREFPTKPTDRRMSDTERRLFE